MQPPDLFNMIGEAMMKKALKNVKGGVTVDGLTETIYDLLMTLIWYHSHHNSFRK